MLVYRVGFLLAFSVLLKESWNLRPFLGLHLGAGVPLMSQTRLDGYGMLGQNQLVEKKNGFLGAKSRVSPFKSALIVPNTTLTGIFSFAVWETNDILPWCQLWNRIPFIKTAYTFFSKLMLQLISIYIHTISYNTVYFTYTYIKRMGFVCGLDTGYRDGSGSTCIVIQLSKKL